LWQKRYFDPTFGGALVPGQRNVVLSTAELTPYAFLVTPRSSSPLVSVLRMSPIGGLGVEWRTDYDHRRGEIVNSLFTMDYRWAKYYVSAGEYQVHTDPLLTAPANQFTFRAGFGEPNHRGWNAGVTGNYDYRAAILRNGIAQVTYNTDCCGLSFQYGRFSFGTRNENQFRLAFAVANIGTFGNLRRQEIYTR
jgi:LPS-assembly protein